MRHYEIMANDCIHVFLNIENYHPNTMKLLPKELLKEGNKLYNKLKNKSIKAIDGTSIDTLTNSEINECNILIQQLLDYTKII